MHPLVEVLHAAKTSASGKRNAALLACDADYLIFTDPDCVADPDWLRALAIATKSGVCFATGRVTALKGGRQTALRTSDQNRTYTPSLLNRATPYRAGASNNMMIERKLLVALGGFPEDLGPGTPNGVAEDAEVIYRALALEVPIHFVAAARVMHDHPESDEEFIRKKENYARGIAYFFLRRCKSDPAAWLGLALAFGYSIGCLILYALLLRADRVKQAFAEIRGRLHGASRALLSPGEPPTP